MRVGALLAGVGARDDWRSGVASFSCVSSAWAFTGGLATHLYDEAGNTVGTTITTGVRRVAWADGTESPVAIRPLFVLSSSPSARPPVRSCVRRLFVDAPSDR